MDPILTDIYATVLPSAPYLIAAYALIWVGLLVYVFILARQVKSLEQHMNILEEALASHNECDTSHKRTNE